MKNKKYFFEGGFSENKFLCPQKKTCSMKQMIETNEWEQMNKKYGRKKASDLL